jgi:hypothetical protein
MWAVGVADRLGVAMFCRKNLHDGCRMGGRIVVMNLICSLGHFECDSYTVHKLSQRRLTADWLAPRESDCSPMHSKVSSDWLPSYIKAMRKVVEIFKTDGYFPDSPCIPSDKPCSPLYGLATWSSYHLYTNITVKGKGKAVPLQAWGGPAGCHPYAPAAFTPRKCSWYSFLSEAESTPGP